MEVSPKDHPDLIEPIMEAHEYEELTQTQRIGFRNGVLSHLNVMLVADTGNGKTLCAESRVKLEVESGNRVAYLVPSKQLKAAKSDTLNKWANFDVMVSGRDNDAYEEGDVVVATFEGYYQMCLQHPAKISDISLVVLDDFHFLYDSYRGFTLEKLITALKRNDVSIFAMSASIGGAENLADWMDAELIISPEDRSIPIYEDVIVRDGSMTIREQVASYIDENPDKAPFLVFNKSKPAAESAAQIIAKSRGWHPDKQSADLTSFTEGGEVEPGSEWVALKRVKGELSEIVEAMTPEMEKLAHLISRGVAYHHAALPGELKDYIVSLYENGHIDTISLTTTLGSGYDAPVQTVIVSDYTRWTREEPTVKIGVWEYEQWIGRAGRPGYGYEMGYAAIIAKNREDVEEYLAPRQLEAIESHVKEDELLRKFLLELIVTGHKTEPDLRQFIDRTLWVHDSDEDVLGVKYEPMDSVKDAVAWLADNKFIERNPTGFRPTALGRSTVGYGFRQFGHYSLIGVRNLYEWINNVDTITKVGLIHAICRSQEITLYKSDVTEIIEPFEDDLLDYDLDPESEFSQTTGVLLWYWCENRDLEDASKASGLRAEFTQSVARQVYDVLLFVPDLIDVASETEVPEWHEIFKLQIKHGVTQGQAELVNSVDGLGRVRVRELAQYLASLPNLRGDDITDRLADFIDKNSPKLVKETLNDQVYDIGKEISGRLVDTVVEKRELA